MKIFIVLCVCFISSQAALENFFLVRNSVIKDKFDLGRVNDAEPADCAERCEEMDECLSFMYKAEHRKCDLSSGGIHDNDLIRSVHGWEIYALYPNRVKTAELTAELSRHAEEAVELRSNIETIQANIKKMEKQLQNATEQIETMIDERDGLAEDTDTLVALLQSTNDTMAEVVASYEEIMDAKEILEQQLNEKESQITEMESKVEDLNKSVGNKNTNLKQIYAAKAEVESQLAEVNSEVHVLQSRVTSLTSQVRQLEADLDAADDPKVYVARDCFELYRLHDVKENGVYDIYPFGPRGKKVQAYCYMGDGGGWTVIQRRDTASGCAQAFDKTWNEYRNGFGNPSGDYWLGNDAISSLTTQRSELKVYVKNALAHNKYSHYRDFQMDSHSANFRLKSIRYTTGSAGDKLSSLRGSSFGTKDKENNNNKCSSAQFGGFWFKTSRYCAKTSWWSCSRYAYSCSGTNINARNPLWVDYSHTTEMRIRTQ